ncbi:hypothetical protein D3C85_1266190 [compost metagenome]
MHLCRAFRLGQQDPDHTGMLAAQLQVRSMRAVIRGIQSHQNPRIRIFAEEALQIVPGLVLEVVLHGIFQVDNDPIRTSGDGFGDALGARGRHKQGGANNRRTHGVSPRLNSTSPTCAMPS